MIIVGLRYTFKDLTTLREVTGGTPYGASRVTGVGHESRMPSNLELEMCRFQGEHVSRIASPRFRKRGVVSTSKEFLPMRASRYGTLGVLCSIYLCGPLHPGALAAPADRGDTAHLARQDLIGAWRLVRIEYSAPQGPIADPFYQADSTGVIIYDSSGWMSVHIVAPHRRGPEVPATRLSSSAMSRDMRLKAAAFDTYYSYFGTWDFDEATSVVTHHVKSSLIPAESGLNYAQKATLESGRLVFTVRSGGKGQETVRRKIWERVAGDAK
jgi:hypothetical protein